MSVNRLRCTAPSTLMVTLGSDSSGLATAALLVLAPGATRTLSVATNLRGTRFRHVDNTPNFKAISCPVGGADRNRCVHDLQAVDLDRADWPVKPHSGTAASNGVVAQYGWHEFRV